MSNAIFETLEDGKIVMNATIPAADVDAAVAQVYRDASKKYKIPGFRPGKAPRSMVENLIGDEYARAMATDQVVNDSFACLVDEQGYRVVGKPEFDEESLVTEGEDYLYVVTFETRPQLTLSDTEVAITMPPREATQKEIDTQIDAIRERFAQLKKVRARKIRDDDVVLLSFKSTVDGEDYEGSEVEKYPYHLGQGMMPPEFEEAIVGAKPGDNVEAEFVIEGGEENTEFAGKPIHFDIELHEIQEPELPEVNDDLAIMSGFESAEEMTGEIRSNIESSKQNSYDNVLRGRLISALAENLEGEVSQDLIDSRAEYLKRDFVGMLGQNQMSLEQYLAMSGADTDEFEKDVALQAKMGVSEELALEALAREKDLEVTDEDITIEMEILAEQAQIPVEEARKKWAEAALMTTLHDELARRKAADWLVANSEVTIDEEAL
ncbi:MAG: trigger factor [Actinomycetia bacterium]|nr:trigger factor [Actinomycetes bacterium]